MTKVPCKEIAVTPAETSDVTPDVTAVRTRIARQFRTGLIAVGVSVALSLPLSQVASADSFEDGVASYLAGDWKKAREIWQPIADDGDPVALFNIGVLYYQGLGVPADTTKAVEMYRTAAQHGYAPAQFNLGAAYRNGVGVPQSDAEAANWWQLAADQGEIQAQYNLGMLYAKGLGVTKDENTARYFFEQAARRGDQRAAQAIAALASGSAPSAVVSVAKKVKTDALDDDTVAPVESSETITSTVVEETTTTVTEAPAPAPEPVVEAPAPAPEVVVSAPAPAPTPAPAPVVMPAVDGQGAGWVLNNSPTAYTIQIYASGDPAAAQKFIDRHGLGDMAHVVPAVSGSKLWYKVVYGSFGSTADAKNARSLLPVAIQKNSPWIRKFSSVQNELAPDAASTTEVVSAPAPVPVPVAAPTPAPAPEVVVVTENDPNAAVQETTSTTIIVGDIARTVGTNGEEAVTTIVQPAAETVPETTVTTTAVAADQTSVIQPVVEQPVVQPESIEPKVALAENAPAPAVQAAATTTVAVAAPTSSKLANNDGANPALAFSEGQRAFNQQDYAAALQHWLPLAETGHAESQYGLGFMHETGWGVSRDASQAMGWYKRAAEQGYAKAQYNLGMMYLLGNGVPEDEAMGLYWIQSAADQNDLRARAQLSRLRTSGGS